MAYRKILLSQNFSYFPKVCVKVQNVWLKMHLNPNLSEHYKFSLVYLIQTYTFYTILRWWTYSTDTLHVLYLLIQLEWIGCVYLCMHIYALRYRKQNELLSVCYKFQRLSLWILKWKKNRTPRCWHIVWLVCFEFICLVFISIWIAPDNQHP